MVRQQSHCWRVKLTHCSQYIEPLALHSSEMNAEGELIIIIYKLIRIINDFIFFFTDVEPPRDLQAPEELYRCACCVKAYKSFTEVVKHTETNHAHRFHLQFKCSPKCVEAFVDEAAVVVHRATCAHFRHQQAEERRNRQQPRQPGHGRQARR